MVLEALCAIGTMLVLCMAPIPVTLPNYYYNMSELRYQEINKPQLEHLITQDNPTIQLDNIIEIPYADLIVWLSYKDESLRELQNHQFAKYINLSLLILNDNHLQTLHNKSFQGLSRLEFLHLQNNEIQFLPEGIFDPLANIAGIDLSNNKIASLPEDIFRLNTRLQGLDLQKNPLTSIVLQAGNPLRSLLLSDCDQLKEVQLAIDLFNLTLENSGVEHLKVNGSIQNIRVGNSKLTHLDFHGARFNGSLLNDVLCKSRSLEWLDLSNTSLDTIHLSSTNRSWECLLPSLRFLNLSTNHIQCLPMGSPLFGRQLITLDLSHNHLRNVSFETLKEAQSLQSLYLDGNREASFDSRSTNDQFKDLKILTFDVNNFTATFYNNQKVPKVKEMPKDQKMLKVPEVAEVPEVEEVLKVDEVPKVEVVPKVEKVPKDLKISKVEEVPKMEEATKDQMVAKNQMMPMEEQDPKDPKVPQMEKVLKVKELPMNQMAPKVEEEQKDQCTWIWFAVPFIVLLLIALVCLVLRNRDTNCYGSFMVPE